MESVEDWALEQALEGEGKVLDREDKGSVVNQVAQTHPVVFELHCVVVKVELAIFITEDRGVGSFNGEELAGLVHFEVFNFDVAH
jgi:hypothetical protein